MLGPSEYVRHLLDLEPTDLVVRHLHLPSALLTEPIRMQAEEALGWEPMGLVVLLGNLVLTE